MIQRIITILLLLIWAQTSIATAQELVQKGEIKIQPLTGDVPTDAIGNPVAAIDIYSAKIDDMSFVSDLIIDKKKIDGVKWRLYVYVPNGSSTKEIMICKPGYMPFHLEIQPGFLIQKKLYSLELVAPSVATTTQTTPQKTQNNPSNQHPQKNEANNNSHNNTGHQPSNKNKSKFHKIIDDYRAQIWKSNSDIADSKKAALFYTWENRGKLLVEAFKANTKGVYASMPASKSNANPFNNLELIVGTPTEKKKEGEYELWVYPTITYYIQNDQVQFWKETYVADPDALTKAADAYKKAAELDPNGAYKSKNTTKELIKDLRNALYNDGINAYMLKDYKTAIKNFSKALELADYPRAESDTIIQDGQIAYYIALSANESGDKDQAEKMFREAAKLNYQISSCYHYIYLITKDKGNEAAAFKILTDAYNKYPKEEQLLYDIINYYLEKKQYNEAENFLNTAINQYPNKLVLYSVKASIYVNNYTALKNKYRTDCEKMLTLKKEAFRERNNAAEKARIEREIAAQEKVMSATKANFMTNLGKAADCYKKILTKDPNNYDANFMLGILSYNTAELVQIEKDNIYMSEDKDGSIATAKDRDIRAYWKESCEWFEKAHKAKPKEKNPLQNLKMLYYKLGDIANNARVKALLNNM